MQSCLNIANGQCISDNENLPKATFAVPSSTSIAIAVRCQETVGTALHNKTLRINASPCASMKPIPAAPHQEFCPADPTTRMDVSHIPRAWVVLMKRLGYTKFVAQGGDCSSSIRWKYRHRRNCSAFTATCLASFHSTLTKRLFRGDHRRRAFRPMKSSLRPLSRSEALSRLTVERQEKQHDQMGTAESD